MRVDSGTTNAIDSNTEQALIHKLEQLFPNTDAVIVSDYNYGILTDKVINAIAKLQQNHPRVLVVDSKNLTAYRHLNITAVKPNYDQALQLLGIAPIHSEEISRAEQIKPYGEKLRQILHQRWGASAIVPVGSDVQQAVRIITGIGGESRILPRGSLRDFAAALACGDLVVAADTGAARIAVALNVLTITLFGPSWYGRYGQPLPHVNLQGYPECGERNPSNFTEQSCWYSGVCPLDKGWQSCMDGISVDEVLGVVERFLDD
ncbi:MAG: glycosyltransferase family 9 protein [Scytonema sp. PMC 1069.18]|nr:glycosyltransferase family 9 protein [Scytonema sp. PMC 1069.18]MEC4882324.1 glycosyltransferase family 9 protein [Scytonema sp. PMC 1070.18]